MFNLPNFISLARVILTVPCLIFYSAGQNNLGFGVIILMIITDFADGMVARKYDNVSDFGKAFDPICDKIVMIALFTYLIFNKEFPLWFFILRMIGPGHAARDAARQDLEAERVAEAHGPHARARRARSHRIEEGIARERVARRRIDANQLAAQRVDQLGAK